jgi:hypothetical protein
VNHRVKVAPGKLDNALREAPEDSFFYIDAAGYTDASGVAGASLWAVVERAAARRPGRVAVFDPEGVVEDPAQVFFHGGRDFLPPSLLEAGVSWERFAAAGCVDGAAQCDGDGAGGAAVGPTPGAGEAAAGAAAVGETASVVAGAERGPLHVPEIERPAHEIVSGADWSDVVSGGEYTFWLLFAELDEMERYTAHTSDAYTSRVVQSFREHLLAETERYGGHIWMWKRFGGLLLFPYDGERCMPIVPVVRMFMNRVVANVEHYQLKNLVSYRMALHLGNTTYQDAGSTGDLVSADVNFIFHLGAKHTRPGEMTITRSALSYVPAGLQRYFVDRGIFEDHQTYGMRRINFTGASPT